jgi:hypothetical protein
VNGWSLTTLFADFMIKADFSLTKFCPGKFLPQDENSLDLVWISIEQAEILPICFF